LGDRLGPIFKGQEIQKREQNTKEVNSHSLLFLRLSLVIFQKPAVIPFIGKEAPNFLTIEILKINPSKPNGF